MVLFSVIEGVIIPFIGTTLGAACVFFLKSKITTGFDRALSGFAGGVMVAASFFSLILPAIEDSAFLGKLSFIPVTIGFLAGILFLILLDIFMPYFEFQNNDINAKTTKLVIAVTIHNLPEGMAVGILYAGLIYGNGDITLMSALALSVGIALQNFPEGAIVSMPLKNAGMSKTKSFVYGMLSGAVEPIGAVLTIVTAGFFLPLMPYFLSFAAGAMIYVVIEELMPSKEDRTGFSTDTLFFAIGFILMLALDVGLG